MIPTGPLHRGHARVKNLFISLASVAFEAGAAIHSQVHIELLFPLAYCR